MLSIAIKNKNKSAIMLLQKSVKSALSALCKPKLEETVTNEKINLRKYFSNAKNQ